jgi:hypothetical protein
MTEMRWIERPAKDPDARGRSHEPVGAAGAPSSFASELVG